jgi:glycosyltransferase involved in cell wall biosynthesis
MKTPSISVVVPVYNEALNIKPFLFRIEEVFEGLNVPYEIIFALDPSSDETEKIINEEMARNKQIKLLVFSRRFGQPAATIAGIHYATGDSCVVIDVDLQDPPELISELYERFKSGFDVVYARRRSRKGETVVKRLISFLGYFVINKYSDTDIPRNTGDFRIMSRRVMEELKKLSESHGFLRGMVAFIGFPQSFIDYDRDERLAGKGNYNRFFGSITIGLNGLIGFSRRPLQLMSIIGVTISFLSFALGIWYLIQHMLGIYLAPGLPTTILVVTFLSGIQLLGMGLMGEYIGRIYDEVKGRPGYIVNKKVNFD